MEGIMVKGNGNLPPPNYVKHDGREEPKDFSDEFSRPTTLDPENKITKLKPTKDKVVAQGEAELESSALSGLKDDHASSSVIFLTQDHQNHANKIGFFDDKVGEPEGLIPLASGKTNYIENISPRSLASSDASLAGTDIPIACGDKTEGSKDSSSEILTTDTAGDRDGKIGENICLSPGALATDIICKTEESSDLHSTALTNDRTIDSDYKAQGNSNLMSEAYIMDASGVGNSKIEDNNGLTSEVIMSTETKKEDANERKVIPLMETSPPLSLCEAYNNMFLIFYGLPHNIFMENIMVAVPQCLDLLSLASELGALPIVRHQIQAHLNGYGERLLISIKDDPIRWLKISIDLQSTAIFREAVIHTVGTYPSWCQDTSRLSSLPLNVQSLIQRKWDDLHRSLDDVNSILLRSTIVITPEDKPVSLEQRDTFETWIVVQIWRDWLLSRLRILNSNLSAEVVGRFYLLLSCPSDTYLTVEHVRALLWHVKGDGFGAFENLAEDLELLKSFARSAVRDVCVNNSDLDVKGEGIEYLTCTNLSDDEIPWLNSET
jgi:hypothetical protein